MTGQATVASNNGCMLLKNKKKATMDVILRQKFPSNMSLFYFILPVLLLVPMFSSSLTILAQAVGFFLACQLNS